MIVFLFLESIERSKLFIFTFRFFTFTWNVTLHSYKTWWSTLSASRMCINIKTHSENRGYDLYFVYTYHYYNFIITPSFRILVFLLNYFFCSHIVVCMVYCMFGRTTKRRPQMWSPKITIFCYSACIGMCLYGELVLSCVSRDKPWKQVCRVPGIFFCR